MLRFRTLALLWTAALGLGAGALLAVNTARIYSTVTDETGKPVRGEDHRHLPVDADVQARSQGVPFTAYTPFTAPDIGRDGLAGTADDTTIEMYNQNRDTLGQNRVVIKNNALFDQTYKGLEITANKRFSDRWLMLVGYTWASTQVLTDGVANPNQAINSKGPVFNDRPHTLKASGSYLLPGDWNVSANVRTQAGPPVTRTLRVTGLNQGSITVNAEERGSERLDYLTTVDARVSKVFRLAASRELELNLDVYNIGNINTVWEVRTLTGRINLRYAGDPPAHPPAYPSGRIVPPPPGPPSCARRSCWRCCRRSL